MPGAVKEILPVSRGRTDQLDLHSGTMVLIEALAAGKRAGALANLERLSALRGAIDKTWLKRGARPKCR